MQIQVSTDSHIRGSDKLSRDVETIVQHALGRFGGRITRVEVFFSDENSDQKSGDTDKRCVIEARLGGLQPITVSHHASSVNQALGGAVGKLQKTLKRALRRKVSLSKRRWREQADWTAAGPVLQHDVETGKQDEFTKVLRPLLGHLRQHARRELRIMEANGTLDPGQVVVADLLDEVVTRAWLQFADRPQGMALDLWLTSILDGVLEEPMHREQRTPESLHAQREKMRPQNVPQVDDQEWWVWLLGEDETPTNDEALPSRQSTWAEEFLAAEELMDRIHAILGELPMLRRRAFVLNVLEAYEPFEIAMLQDRPESEVRADIEAARGHLRERLRAGSQPHELADPAGDALAAAPTVVRPDAHRARPSRDE